jgi:hypothetical protein
MDERISFPAAACNPLMLRFRDPCFSHAMANRVMRLQFSSLITALVIFSHVVVHFTLSHPLHARSSSSSSSSSPTDSICHGMQPGSIYHYQYKTHMLLNNNDQKVIIYTLKESNKL